MRHSQPVIQPLVEKNAIVHGIQPCRGKGVVTIAINECGKRYALAYGIPVTVLTQR